MTHAKYNAVSLTLLKSIRSSEYASYFTETKKIFFIIESFERNF